MGDSSPRNLRRATCQDSSELLPSFGWSSSSSWPTLPWSTAENSSPSFSPNRVREDQSQISPSDGSFFDVSPLSPIEPNQEKGMPQPSGVLLPTILDEFNDSVLGEPISYARLEQAPGPESPLSLPVYAWPPKSTFVMDPIIQTILAPPKRDMLPAGTTWTRYHRHHVRDGQHGICRPWDCGALRRIQLRRDLLRHRRDRVRDPVNLVLFRHIIAQLAI